MLCGDKFLYLIYMVDKIGFESNLPNYLELEHLGVIYTEKKVFFLFNFNKLIKYWVRIAF